MDDIEDFLDTQSRTLVRPMESLRELGNDIGSVGETEALERLRVACQFCSDTLLPLLEAHERVLDPAVTGLPGELDVGHALGAERLRLRGFISALTRRLEEGRVDPQARAALRRELYLLHAVTGVYLARLRALYLPLLVTRLDAESERALVQQLRLVARSPSCPQAEPPYAGHR
jgi:hypothetical protein